MKTGKITTALLCLTIVFCALVAPGNLVAEESVDPVARDLEEAAMFLEAVELYEAGDPAAAEKFDAIIARYGSNGARSSFHEGALYYRALCFRDAEDEGRAAELIGTQLTLYPAGARAGDAKKLYLELTGEDFEVGFALATPDGCFSSFVGFIRVRDFESAYECCSAKFQRYIPRDVFADAVEISRIEILRADIGEFVDGALHVRYGRDPAQMTEFEIPMMHTDSRWLIDLPYGD